METKQEPYTEPLLGGMYNTFSLYSSNFLYIIEKQPEIVAQQVKIRFYWQI